jgi:prophage DNA circulation protein
MIQETLEKVAKNGPEAVSNLSGVLKSAQKSIKEIDGQIASHKKN